MDEVPNHNDIVIGALMIQLKLKGKLLTAFLIMGITPLLVLGVIAGLIAKSSLEKQAFDLLGAQRDIKAEQIETYFVERVSHTKALANNPHTFQALMEMFFEFQIEGGMESGAFKGLSNEEYDAPESYKAVHDRYIGVFKEYLDLYGYHDIIMMSADTGDVFFTVTKESDFGQRVSSIESSLRDVWSVAAKEGRISISDTKPYEFAGGVPAQFVAAPIRERGEIAGVIALKISIDAINTIMNERSGMGETGESYLIGADLLMRSDSYNDKEARSVVASFADKENGVVNTLASKEIFAGKSGQKVTLNYSGKSVLSAYKPINIEGIAWGIISEIEEHESLAPVTSLIYWIAIVVLIAIVAIFVVSILISAGITKPIAALVEVMRDIRNNSDFTKRVDIKSKDEVGDAARVFNGLLESLEEAFDQVAQVVQSISIGDFSSRVQINASGSILDLKQGVNNTAESINTTFKTLNDVMTSLSQANYDKKIDVSGLDGEYYTAVETGILSMQSAGRAIAAINQVMLSVSNGEFNQRVEADLPGDLSALKDNINASLHVVEKGIEDIKRIALSLSNGNLNQRISSNHPGQFGVLKQSLNDSMDNISSVIKNITKASDIVSSSSNEIAAGNSDMSKRTEEQASSLEQTASSIEELTGTVEQNADNAGQANQLAKNAAVTAGEGGSIVNNAISAMDEITSSSNKIVDIIGVIDEIAFQTNLLALNASVEAARAGEQGRGFAVVATEVRNLAQRSAKAAKEIKLLIQDSVEKVEVGSKLVDKSGQTLDEIVDVVKKVGDMISEIAAASQEQTAGIAQINQAITNMDDITQRNAALAEEASANSEHLNSQALKMKQQVQFFSID